MRKLFSTALLSFLPCLAVLAQDYAVNKIPQALLKNANAVIRKYAHELVVLSPKESVYTTHYAITILNEAGDRWAENIQYYGKLQAIGDVEGYLYNASGKQLKKMKKKDMDDYSAVSAGSLMEDGRIKRHRFYFREYPYTIEYKVEMQIKANLGFPTWVPQPGEMIATEHSSIRVVSSPDYMVRYKMYNYTGKPAVTEEKKKKVMTWKASNLAAIVREPDGPLFHEISTTVLLGPTSFQVEDYKGDMMTWQDFGKFQFSLNKGRDQLPENVKRKVHEIVDNLPANKDRIAALYKFMQKNTRYISVQLGIGGWQPFDATYVASNGYGDCKALTNYMYSLLKEINIPSYYALVRSGKNANYLTEDFPSQQFNHVILCVPDGRDTIWLECTSQTIQPGYLADFTSDRMVLLVNEQGGKMVRTPKYGIKENTQQRKLSAILDESGTLRIKANTRYDAMQQDDLHKVINNLTKEKVKEHLQEQFDFATYDIDRFEYQEQLNTLPYIEEQLDITVSNYATITGKRLFITPNVMTRSYRKPAKDDTRKYEVLLSNEFQEIDSVEIRLPEGFQPEAMPKPQEIASQFGKYRSEVIVKENKLIYHRQMEQYGGRFPAAEYANLVKFYQEVYSADRTRVVLVRQEAPAKKAF